MVKKLFFVLLGTIGLFQGFSQRMIEDTSGYNSTIQREDSLNRELRIVGAEEVCAGGAQEVYSLNYLPEYAQCQWFVDGKSMLHENNSSFVYNSSYDLNMVSEIGCDVYYFNRVYKEKEYDYLVMDTMHLKNIRVVNALCCEDPKKRPVSRRLVWKEEFGKFHSESDYSHWRQPDLDDDLYKLEKTDSAWSYCMDSVVPNARCVSKPSAPNTYSIAAHVPYEQLGSPALVDSPYFRDHTDDSDSGCALFVHLNEESDTVLYSAVIDGLCDEYFSSYSARFYVMAFAENEERLQLSLRVVDMATGDTVTAGLTNNMINSSTYIWSSYWRQFDLTGNSVRLEILTTRDYLKRAKDVIFVLDDIQLWMCVPHNPYLEVQRESEMMVGGETSSVFVDPSPAGGDTEVDDPLRFLTDGLNGKLWTLKSVASAIQYTTTPYDLSSWKTANGTDEFERLIAEQGKLYFRYLMGPAELIDSVSVNPHDRCTPFFVSNVVEYKENDEQERPKVATPLVSDVLYCEGEVSNFLHVDIVPIDESFYYKWYGEGVDSLGTEKAPKAVSKMKAGDDELSVYDYYVSMCDRQTGEESEKAHLQVFVVRVPDILPDRLSYTNEVSVDVESSLSPYFPSKSGYSFVFYEDENGTLERSGEDLESGKYYVKAMAHPFETGKTCKSKLQPVDFDFSCSDPKLNVTVNELDYCENFQFTPVDKATSYRVSAYDGNWNFLFDRSVDADSVGADYMFSESSVYSFNYYVFDVLDADSSLAYREIGSYQNPYCMVAVEKNDANSVVNIYTIDGELFVAVGTDGDVKVRNLLGETVEAYGLKAGEARSFRLTKGVYVVQVNDGFVKVLVD